MKKSNIFPSIIEAEAQRIGLITVCLTPQTADQVTRAMNNMPWEVTSEALDKYLSRNSRAHWSAETKAASSCIAVVDLDSNPAAALETVEFLQQSLPGKVSVMGLSSDTNPAMILQMMRAGCVEYLEKPLNANHFADALARIERRSSTAAASIAVPGQIYSFFGAKGGVGTTTLAVHLAVNLARLHNKKTLLIDNHPGLGHVSLYLGLEGAHYSFPELLRNVERLDVELLKGFVASHSSGLDVLASPDAHGGVRYIDPGALQHTLEFLREEYDYIVVDCANTLDEMSMAVVERSDLVYLVATPEIAAIRDLSRYVDGLIHYDQPTDKLRIVINRSSAKGAMSTLQIEKAVRLPLFTNIPNTYADLLKSINVGVPISHEEKTDFSSHMKDWSRKVAGSKTEGASTSPKKGLAFWK